MEHEGEGRCFIPSKLVNLGVYLVQSNAVNIIYPSQIARAVFTLSLDKRSTQRTFFGQLTTVQTLGSVMLLYQRTIHLHYVAQAFFFPPFPVHGYNSLLEQNVNLERTYIMENTPKYTDFFPGYYWKPSMNLYHANITLFSFLVP